MNRNPLPAAAGRQRLPAGIWAMGMASLLMDASSELVQSLLPVFIVTVLGASVATVGAIEGVAGATAEFVKIFSGALSDRLRRRKWLMVAGYGLAALTKPVFPLATSVAWIFGARFVDRIGKGIRGAPRDALVADITPEGMRGAAYGLRQALDSLGAVAGPLLAFVLMIALAGDVQAVLWVAVVPAFAAVALLAAAVREPARARHAGATRWPLQRAEVSRLSRRYWAVVALGAVLTLARFSEAFLVLRGQDLGMATAQVPLVMVAMSLAYALTAYPAGALGDRVAARPVLLAGLVALVGAHLVLAFAGAIAAVLAGSVLWGIHMGLTHGLLAKLVADAAPADLRGTAFGFFNLVGGFAVLSASLIAGALWTASGPRAAFLTGAAFASVAALGLAGTRARR